MMEFFFLSFLKGVGCWAVLGLCVGWDGDGIDGVWLVGFYAGM
jgi:hypothetical protein